MQLLTVTALILGSALSGIVAAPLRSRNDFSPGAAYWMTNNPTGNALVAANIGSDGTLSLATAYSMVGNGARGNTPFNAPDALYAQGAVQVHAGMRVVAAVNAGSNTIALFSIDPETPTKLTAVGPPTSSGGQFPMSLAFNAAGNILCALNSGEMSGVQCFSVNSTTGLSALPGFRAMGGRYNQTTPPTGPTDTVSQIAFTANDTRIAVAVKGGPQIGLGYVQVWDVQANGTLSTNTSQIMVPTGGMYPFSLTPVPGRNAFLTADFANGVDVFDLDTNIATSLNVTGQIATCWSAYSTRTNSFFTSDTNTGNITEITLGGMGGMVGSVVASYGFGVMDGPIDLEVANLPSADYLYVLMPGAMQVGVLELGGPSMARVVQTMDLTAPAQAVGITMDPLHIAGMAVYVKPATI